MDGAGVLEILTSIGGSNQPLCKPLLWRPPSVHGPFDRERLQKRDGVPAVNRPGMTS